MKTELSDRTLWYDGDSVISSDRLLATILNGNREKLSENLHVDVITKEIAQYNKLQSPKQKIKQKIGLNPIKSLWKKPESIALRFQTYESVKSYILDKFVDKCIEDEILDDEISSRSKRLSEELALYYTHNLVEALQILIHIVETFERENIVWGVGRGSCVSSYVLYVLGVHDVDSVRYGLEITDFIKN